VQLFLRSAHNQEKAMGLGTVAGSLTPLLHNGWLWLAVFVIFSIGFFLAYRKLYFCEPVTCDKAIYQQLLRLRYRQNRPGEVVASPPDQNLQSCAQRIGSNLVKRTEGARAVGLSTLTLSEKLIGN
jgi:hypothetical protein